MKRIRRLRHSTCGLRDYLDCVGYSAEWEDFRSHDAGNSHKELLNELIDLQHGLCGYCEIDLDLDELDRQVEHVVPRSAPDGASRLFDVTNMIACCKGGTESAYRGGRDDTRYREPVRYHQSCGQKKGDRADDEFLDPRTLPALPSLTRVLVNGTMEADAAACESVGESADRVQRTIEILGLNAKRLRDARERRWRALNDAWEDHVDDPDVMEEAARTELLPKNGRLLRFFTTNRSYFGPVSERILEEHPRAWI